MKTKRRITWETFKEDVLQLSEHVRDTHKKPINGIVAVTRGGLVPTAIMAHTLGIRRIETISIVSYTSANTRKPAPIVSEVKRPLEADDGNGWLVVDDLTDSGQTARYIHRMLPASEIAVVYAKPVGLPYIQYCLKHVPQDTWLDFPWEP